MSPDRRALRLLALLALVPATTLAAQSATGFSPSKSGKYVQIYADGAIRGAALGDQGTPSGTGSLGVRVGYDKKSFFARINVASTVDTIAGGFGGVVLSPATGGSFKSGILDFERECGWLQKLICRGGATGRGFHLYGTAAASTWADSLGAMEAVILGGGMLFYKDIAKGFIAGDSANSVRVKFEVGPSFRRVAGYLGSGAAEARRESVLGTTSAWFAGLEMGLNIQFGVVTGALQVYMYSDLQKSPAVPGITGGQLVALFSIGGPIFSGSLTPTAAVKQ